MPVLAPKIFKKNEMRRTKHPRVTIKYIETVLNLAVSLLTTKEMSSCHIAKTLKR